MESLLKRGRWGFPKKGLPFGGPHKKAHYSILVASRAQDDGNCRSLQTFFRFLKLWVPLNRLYKGSGGYIGVYGDLFYRVWGLES